MRKHATNRISDPRNRRMLSLSLSKLSSLYLSTLKDRYTDKLSLSLERCQRDTCCSRFGAPLQQPLRAMGLFVRPLRVGVKGSGERRRGH